MISNLFVTVQSHTDLQQKERRMLALRAVFTAFGAEHMPPARSIAPSAVHTSFSLYAIWYFYTSTFFSRKIAMIQDGRPPLPAIRRFAASVSVCLVFAPLQSALNACCGRAAPFCIITAIPDISAGTVRCRRRGSPPPLRGCRRQSRCRRGRRPRVPYR